MHNGGRSTKTYSLCNFFRHRVTSFYKHSSCHTHTVHRRGYGKKRILSVLLLEGIWTGARTVSPVLVSIAKMFPMALIPFSSDMVLSLMRMKALFWEEIAWVTSWVSFIVGISRHLARSISYELSEMGHACVEPIIHGHPFTEMREWKSDSNRMLATLSKVLASNISICSGNPLRSVPTTRSCLFHKTSWL